jgi:hypothetical protein
MDYRNERDALRGRVEALEEELEDARRELSEARRREGEEQGSREEAARIARLEAAMPDAEALIQRLRGDLSAVTRLQEAHRPVVPEVVTERRWAIGEFGLREVAPTREAGEGGRDSARLVVSAIVAAILVAGIAIVGVVAMRRAKAAAVSAAVHEVPSAPGASAAPERMGEASGGPIELPTSAPTSSAQAESAPRTAHPKWSARVTHTTGSVPPPSTACTVEAALEAASIGIRLTDLTVTCGNRRLYWTEGELARASGTNGIVEEMAGRAPGTWTYALRYEEAGFSTGQSGLVAINTALGKGAVWRDVLPAFRVDFDVAKQSAPVKGEPLAN